MRSTEKLKHVVPGGARNFYGLLGNLIPPQHPFMIKGLTLPRLGGNSNNGAIDGAFARNFNNDASNQNWNRRGRETILSRNLWVKILRQRISQLNEDAYTKASTIIGNERRAPKIVK